MLFRHGDVLIMQIAEMPTGGGLRLAVPILAQGEVTGHSHRIEDPTKAEVWYINGEMFIKVWAPTRVIHEEHQPIPLDPGCYRVWQQREYLAPGQRWHDGVSFRAVRD